MKGRGAPSGDAPRDRRAVPGRGALERLDRRPCSAGGGARAHCCAPLPFPFGGALAFVRTSMSLKAAVTAAKVEDSRLD